MTQLLSHSATSPYCPSFTEGVKYVEILPNVGLWNTNTNNKLQQVVQFRSYLVLSLTI